MNRDVKHPLAAFAIATAATIVLVLIALGVGVVKNNLGALVAIVFLYVPVLFAKLRDEDLETYGLTFKPVGKGLLYGLGAPLIIFPIFLVGFVLFYDIVCAPDAPEILAALPMRGLCPTWNGISGIDWPKLDLGFVELAFVQLIVVALPEELLFRGFILHTLEKAMPPKRRVLGGGVGWALIISSALFAIGHLAAVPDPRRLAVFFPGLLFGWMRSATGSILAGTLCHAASNLFIHILNRMFF